jgi:hypothetical protein
MKNGAGFSEDGYIVDQNCFAAYRYRGMRSDINGCGWIAAYDLRHALGQPVGFEEVRRDMDAMFPIKIPGPTPVRVLRRYLDRHVRVRFSVGKAAVLEAAGRSRAGILRYREGAEPHFVAYTVQADGLCRFFNVADGLEDFTATMKDFLGGHCRRQVVRALTAD